jgi:hypothetical protein
MRIRVLQKPTLREVDGIRLDVFEPGVQYELGNSLGALFLAEGWAEPVPSDEPALVIPLSEFAPDRPTSAPPNLVREMFPPYYDMPTALAADRRRHPRPRRPRRT